MFRWLVIIDTFGNNKRNRVRHGFGLGERVWYHERFRNQLWYQQFNQ